VAGQGSTALNLHFRSLQTGDTYTNCENFFPSFESPPSGGLDVPETALETFFDFNGCSEQMMVQRPSECSEQDNDASVLSPVMSNYTNNEQISYVIPDVGTPRASTIDPVLEESFVNSTGSPLSSEASGESRTVFDSASPQDSFSDEATLCQPTPPATPPAKSSKTAMIQCPFCDKQFDKAHKANKHRLTHTRPFRCKLCNFAASVKRDLRRHGESVHGAGAFFCDVPGCERSRDAGKTRPFGRHDNLVRHGRRVHDTEIKKGRRA